jgi:hypothetical protein
MPRWPWQVHGAARTGGCTHGSGNADVIALLALTKLSTCSASTASMPTPAWGACQRLRLGAVAGRRHAYYWDTTNG